MRALLLESLEPRAASPNKLACVLAQFPNGFKPEGNREEYLRAVVDAFAGVPVIVEFRNAKWQRPETFALLREIGAGYCNVDMPQLDGLLAPSSDAPRPSATCAFTAATPRKWWTGSNVTRYDYIYTAQELVPWTDRIAEVEEQVARHLRLFQQSCERPRRQKRRNARSLTGRSLRRRGRKSRRARSRRAAGANALARSRSWTRERRDYRRRACRRSNTLSAAGTDIKALAVVRGADDARRGRSRRCAVPA